MASSYGDVSPGVKPSPGTYTPESLPSSDPPASASPEQCKVIEENMVAVESKILKGLKTKSNNLWWDGKLAFLQNLEEWVKVCFGEIALCVLLGHRTKVPRLRSSRRGRLASMRRSSSLPAACRRRPCSTGLRRRTMRRRS